MNRDETYLVTTHWVMRWRMIGHDDSSRSNSQKDAQYLSHEPINWVRKSDDEVQWNCRASGAESVKAWKKMEKEDWKTKIEEAT